MRGIGKDGHRLAECRLDVRERDAVLAALIAVAFVPIEARNAEVHRMEMSFVHTNVNATCSPHAPRAASEVARILLSVVAGVIASGSIRRWMMAGLPASTAARNAAGKSSVRSTVTP